MTCRVSGVHVVVPTGPSTKVCTAPDPGLSFFFWILPFSFPTPLGHWEDRVETKFISAPQGVKSPLRDGPAAGSATASPDMASFDEPADLSNCPTTLPGTLRFNKSLQKTSFSLVQIPPHQVQGSPPETDDG